jgi:protein-S-isoprenylcysteine O-methyltransferase Ste14
MASFMNSISIIIIAICWIIFLIYWLVSAFFAKKSVTKYNWKFVILSRVAIIFIIIIFLRFNKLVTVSFFGFLFGSQFSFPILAPVLTVIGLFGAVWARTVLGRNWSGYATYKENQELITTGPYKFVRHPIYSSMLLMLIGTILYYGYLFLLVIFAIVAVTFIWRTKKEEKIMTKLFGKKYQNYMKRTKRLIPFVY